MVLPVAVTRAVAGDRWRDLGLAAALILWLTYTRFYWALHASHVALPACPFYVITGHPCPFCGGTRSFAYMWEGDLSDSVRLYPLGPALFAGSLVGTLGLVSSALSGRTWSLSFTAKQWRILWIGAAAAIGVSWLLKWFVLGN